MRGRVWGPLAIAISLAAMTAGGVVIAQEEGGGAAFEANAFVVASGGSPSCVRSASLIEYADAAGVNAVCGPGNGNVGFTTTGFDNACDITNAGDIVGVKNGDYNQPISNGYVMGAGEDCAPGASDYNPNWEEQGVSDPTSNLTSWTTFMPADDTPDIMFEPRGMVLAAGNYHMIWKNIDINTGLYFNTGGGSTRLQNVIVRGNSAADRANVHGIQIIGSKNVLLLHLDYGPSTQCGKAADANVPDAYECDPNADTFESQYANRGTTAPGCTTTDPTNCGGFHWNGASEWVELYIHDINSSLPFENVRLEDVINHDQQSKQDGSGLHPGCLMTWDFGDFITTAHNLVLDHYRCERTTAATTQIAASGVTIQNSVIGCKIQSLQNSGGLWDGTCTGAALGIGQKLDASRSPTNILIRYITLIGGGQPPMQLSAGGAFDTFSNTRVVGNLFFGNPTCGTAGVTYSTNTYTNGSTSCESDGTATVLGAGDPIVDSSYDTANNLYVLEGEAFDPSADGSPALTNLNPTTKNTACGCTDYTLDHDFEGDARSSTATKPGADG
jgi:hypothetical protein